MDCAKYSGNPWCIALCVMHSSLCIQIYLHVSQPNDLIKSDIETIEAKFSLYITRIRVYSTTLNTLKFIHKVYR